MNAGWIPKMLLSHIHHFFQNFRMNWRGGTMIEIWHNFMTIEKKKLHGNEVDLKGRFVWKRIERYFVNFGKMAVAVFPVNQWYSIYYNHIE